MGAGDRRFALDVSSFVREFDRVRRGYDPAAVDHHLALIKSQVGTYLERETHDPDESLDLVLRATKRSVDEALQDARERADAILAEAHAEAAEIRQEARTEATRLTADAEERVRALDGEGRERYAEMGRLTEARGREMRRIDAELRARTDSLRSAAEDLARIAASIEVADTGPAPSVPSPIAAMTERQGEIVLPADPGSDA
ncbi:MAG: DivIVA domain-containing protein [Acidimicrobiales bacterium]|nr:DivIVA domain-containing protein [Acidimicrobiales bacterium]